MECVSTGAGTRRSLGHHLAPAGFEAFSTMILKPRALFYRTAPADPNSKCMPCTLLSFTYVQKQAPKCIIDLRDTCTWILSRHFMGPYLFEVTCFRMNSKYIRISYT